MSSFRSDAQHRTNLEIPGLVLTHHPGMTKPPQCAACQKQKPRLEGRARRGSYVRSLFAHIRLRGARTERSGVEGAQSTT